ncbi:MAG: hypothetical protein IKA90_01045, partial [Clostridia bacterium]|nr:hypothetical protein [Clostridia bacterium]
IGNRRYISHHICQPTHCNNKKPPSQTPCKPPCQPRQPFCFFEIRCTPFDDCPPQVKFEFKI